VRGVARVLVEVLVADEAANRRSSRRRIHPDGRLRAYARSSASSRGSDTLAAKSESAIAAVVRVAARRCEEVHEVRPLERAGPRRRRLDAISAALADVALAELRISDLPKQIRDAAARALSVLADAFVARGSMGIHCGFEVLDLVAHVDAELDAAAVRVSAGVAVRAALAGEGVGTSILHVVAVK
jgi:hypothetical protein